MLFEDLTSSILLIIYKQIVNPRQFQVEKV